MPQRAAKTCRFPGCFEVVASGYCDKHVMRHSRTHHRLSASRRGYDARWRRLRGMFIRSHPLCADPFDRHAGKPIAATDVDHIVPLSSGGTNNWTNLQSLCHSCHSLKTNREMQR